MGMTITEKILASHARKTSVKPGENVWVDVDVLMTHDVCGPGTIGVFKQHFGTNAKVWNPEKVVVIPDHYIFTSDEKAHRNVDVLREFAKEQALPYFYDPGTEKYRGVCHVTLAEEGHTRPGEVLFGTDSHTCTAGAFGEFATGIGNTEAGFVLGAGKLWVKVPETMRIIFDGPLPLYLMAKDLILEVIGELGVDGAIYRAMEFTGEGVYSLNIDERMTLCNMVIEAGGKNGIIEPDDATINFIRSRTKKPFEIVTSDQDAKYHNIHVYRVKDIEPVVAKPHSPDHKDYARRLKDVKIDRAYIGSCTGGKLTDFIAAAKILKGKQVKVGTFIVPATRKIARSLETEMFHGKSLKQIFLDAGAVIGEASCAACLGGPVDTFGRLNNAEVCLSTTNRNFPGRMGSPKSQVYLASPYTVTASALTGHITDPREFLK